MMEWTSLVKRLSVEVEVICREIKERRPVFDKYNELWNGRRNCIGAWAERWDDKYGVGFGKALEDISEAISRGEEEAKSPADGEDDERRSAKRRRMRT